MQGLLSFIDGVDSGASRVDYVAGRGNDRDIPDIVAERKDTVARRCVDRGAGIDVDGNISCTANCFGMGFNSMLRPGNSGPGCIIDGYVSVSVVIGVNSETRVRNDIGIVVDDDGAVHIKVRCSACASQKACG